MTSDPRCNARVGPWMVLVTLLANAAFAQEGLRPADERPPSPPLRDSGDPLPEIGLPPLPAPEDAGRLSSGIEVYLERIVVEGSTIFSDAELSEATEPFEGRWVGPEEIHRARDAVTALYHERGFVTSGAFLPDQEVDDGVVVLVAVEGRLEEIAVRGERFFRSRYFRDRLSLAGRAPVNVWRLERALQRLQQNPYIDRVSARLEPGSERGTSRLEVAVEEAFPLHLDLAGSNYRSPSLGEFAGEVNAEAANLVGVADALRVSVEVAEGLRDLEAGYEIPITRFDTLATFRVRDSRGEVVIDEFEPLDIESLATSYGVGIEQPLFRDAGRELRLGILGELRESETEIADSEFCTIAEATDCDPRVAALRFFQQLTRSGQRSAFAFRSTVSLGIDALGATRNRGDVADGRFLAWLGQVQGVYRLSEALLSSTVVGRVDVQLANDPLLSIEKFSVGGARTVRGYRENTLVRDNGAVGSLEIRVPLLPPRYREFDLQLVPFLDVGHAWDQSGPGKLERDTLVGAGAGLRFGILGAFSGEFFYGARLLSAPGDDVSGLQREGLHFRIVAKPLARWR